MKKRICLIIFGVITLLVIAFLLYTGQYYHADKTALAALESDDTVQVTETEYGWFFDGPSETEALIFYPGAKVEETAYAPLLHLIAKEGMDVCLVKMPFRLAFFGINSADQIMQQYDYTSWYIGGHSLGGAMAADYASRNSEDLTGIVLLASYSVNPLDDSVHAISIYGSEDGVLDHNSYEESQDKGYWPEDTEEFIIEGGNHALFGSYGFQKGDRPAEISSESQQRQTAETVTDWIRRKSQ